MNKRVLIVAISLLPSPLFARDSIIPQYGGDSSASPAEYWNAYSRGGYLTREHATQYGIREFSRIDRNADGRVSQEEWNTWHQPKSSPAFSASEWKRYDRNRDGFIGKHEASEMDTRTWTHADLNADGKISKKEWQAVASNSRNLSDWQRADRDNNGFLTRVEAIALDTATFTRMDADGDGLLSQKEWDLGGAQNSGVSGRPGPMFPDAK